MVGGRRWQPPGQGHVWARVVQAATGCPTCRHHVLLLVAPCAAAGCSMCCCCAPAACHLLRLPYRHHGAAGGQVYLATEPGLPGLGGPVHLRHHLGPGKRGGRAAVQCGGVAPPRRDSTWTEAPRLLTLRALHPNSLHLQLSGLWCAAGRGMYRALLPGIWVTQITARDALWTCTPRRVACRAAGQYRPNHHTILSSLAGAGSFSLRPSPSLSPSLLSTTW